MSAATTMFGLLRAEAEREPQRALFRFFDEAGRPQSTLTLAELAGVTARLGRVLAAALAPDAEEPAPVLLCTGPGRDQALGLFACWAAGTTAVPVYPPGPHDYRAATATLAGVARASGARTLLAPSTLGYALDRALREEMGESAPRLVSFAEEDLASEAGAPRFELPPHGTPADAALLLYTSGSTGDPKGVVITHAGLLANMRALVELCVPGAARRSCTWLPHAHIAGLYSRLLALVAGGEVCVLPPSAFLARPATWLELIARERCTMAAAPDFAYALCARALDDATVATLDLAGWRMAVSGGERVRASTVDSFFARLAPTGLRPEALHPYYGMTETLCNAIPQRAPARRLRTSKRGLAFGRVRVPEDEDDVLELIGNGPPLGDETEIIAVHPTGRWRCPPGQIGELWTRGPAVTPGYHGDPARTRELAQARLNDGEGPYFRTGDLGLVHEGQVFITGRHKELLIVRGKNHYPQDIESCVRRATGLGDGCVVAFTVIHDGEEALGLALELEPGGERIEDVVRAARRAVAAEHGLAIAQMYLLEPGALPRTPTHKIERERCRRLAESGAWDEHKASQARRRPPHLEKRSNELPALAGLRGEALRTAILAALVRILAEGEAGELAPEQLERNVAELALSSLELARVAVALRTSTSVEVPFAILFGEATIRELAGTLATLIEDGQRPVDELLSWRKDLRAIAGSLPDKLPPPRDREGAILLTGATGFLGSYLLASLLRRGELEVRCLVRAADEAAGLARLVAALEAGPGWEDSWRERLTVLPGDLLQPRLGQGDTGWRRLIEEVALIVHNAANVDFVAPYAALRPVNVTPVHSLVELAVAGGSCKTLHFVSTLAVFNATFRREQRLVHGFDRLLKPDHLYSGYAQTKWVAEACFRVAGARGIPMGIHRPGLITGALTDGHTNIDDFMCRFILGCIALGTYPEAELELDLVAVDEVAEGIAAAVGLPRRDEDIFVETYHWSNPRPVLLEELMQVYRERGHALRAEPLSTWLERVRSGLPPDNPLFPVHPFLLEIPEGSDETILEFMDGLPHEIDTREADAVRAAAGIPRRADNRELMHRMAAWLEARGHLASPSRTPPGDA